MKQLRGKYWDRELETMPLDQLREMQWEKLKRQLRYLFDCSAFYQAKFDVSGLEFGDIKGFDDFSKIPFTIKQETRDSQQKKPPFGSHLATSIDKVVRIHTTSGTTGVPVVLPLTKHDLEVWNESAGRMFWSAGIRPTDIFLNGFAMSLFTAGLSGCTPLENIGVAVIPCGAEAGTEKLLRLIQYMRPAVLACTPSFAEYLAEAAPKILGIQARDLGVKRMLCGGETGANVPNVKKNIEDKWGVKLFDWGGIGDLCIYIWGSCEQQDGMHHMAQDNIYYELINPDTEELIELKSNGEYKGELVYSHIDREAGPLIRFRSRDVVRVNTCPCSCGRTSYRIYYEGRSDEMLIVKGINVFPSAIKDVISNFIPETTGNIRIIVPKDAVLPKVSPPLVIRVEHGSQVTEEGKGELKKKLRKELQSRLTFHPEIELVAPDSLEKFMMKAKLVERE